MSSLSTSWLKSPQRLYRCCRCVCWNKRVICRKSCSIALTNRKPSHFSRDSTSCPPLTNSGHVLLNVNQPFICLFVSCFYLFLFLLSFFLFFFFFLLNSLFCLGNRLNTQSTETPKLHNLIEVIDLFRLIDFNGCQHVFGSTHSVTAMLKEID